MRRAKGRLFRLCNQPLCDTSAGVCAKIHALAGSTCASVASELVRLFALAIWAIACCVGCLPTLVVIDRASVIEEESAGQWADIERAFDLLHADLYPSLEPGLDPAVLPSSGSASAVLPGGAVPPAPSETSLSRPVRRAETTATEEVEP